MKGSNLNMESQFPKDLLEKIEQSGVIAVLIIDNVEDAVPVAKALLEGGITAMELTLRTPAAMDSLIEINKNVPEMLAGIGTVLTTDQLENIVKAGAAFAVAPGLNPDIVLKAKELSLPFAPGVATPSELEKAVSLGCRVLKFFPAEAIGGLKYLKSFAAPYKHLGLRCIPLGGLNAANMSDYLKEPLVCALGGSWIAKRELILNKDFKTITKNAAQARKIADQTRKEINS